MNDETSTVEVRNPRRRVYSVLVVWAACMLLFIVLVIILRWRSASVSVAFVIVLGIVAIMVGFWRLSSYLRRVPASISVNPKELSVVVMSLIGRRGTVDLKLAQIRSLNVRGSNTRVKSLLLEMVDGARMVFQDVDARTAQEVERLFRDHAN